MPLTADYFDGQRAEAHRVVLRLENAVLSVEGDGVARRDALRQLRISEPLGGAPRLIKFADGAHCEVRDLAGIEALLQHSGHRDGWVVRMQARWSWVLLAVLLSVAAVGAAYRWGLPAAADVIARRLPENVLARMGSVALDLLDARVLGVSKLAPAQQQALRARFEHLAQNATPPSYPPHHRIVFRDGPAVGANAFALPDGSIVVTDQLVALAHNDDEIVGVLAHELGHLHYRHSVRMLIQGSVTGLVMAWYIGDVSSIAAGLPTVLLQARYSRDSEREADRYAADLLRANGIAPQWLAEMLLRLEAAHAKKGEATRGSVLDYIASHPATAERIAALRQ